MKKFPTKVVTKLFNDSELLLLEEILKDNPVIDINWVNVNMAKNASVDPDNSNLEKIAEYVFPNISRKYEFCELINSKIRAELDPGIECDNWHILDARLPYEVHADSYDDTNPATMPKDGTEYAYTFVIPLDDYNADTVVFNEESYFTPEPIRWFNETNPEIKKSITEDEFQKYMTHYHNKWIYDYFSIETIFPWIKGHLLAMSRHSFHCSSNFKARGLFNKRALVGWSTIKKE